MLARVMCDNQRVFDDEKILQSATNQPEIFALTREWMNGLCESKSAVPI